MHTQTRARTNLYRYIEDQSVRLRTPKRRADMARGPGRKYSVVHNSLPRKWMCTACRRLVLEAEPVQPTGEEHLHVCFPDSALEAGPRTYAPEAALAGWRTQLARSGGRQCSRDGSHRPRRDGRWSAAEAAVRVAGGTSTVPILVLVQLATSAGDTHVVKQLLWKHL